MSELIGYTYTFPREDKRSFLRDGREYSTMLNSCGRINRSGVGMAICMGDRNKILTEAEKTILTDYRKMIREYMNILSNERWRISESETLCNGKWGRHSTRNNDRNNIIINCRFTKKYRKNCNFKNQEEKKIQ